jgi:hypothetical protein
MIRFSWLRLTVGLIADRLLRMNTRLAALTPLSRDTCRVKPSITRWNCLAKETDYNRKYGALVTSPLSRLSLLLLMGMIAAPMQATESNMADLTARSQFIFRGTIVKVDATTIRTLAVSQPTAIVHVDDIVESTEAFAGLRGKNITIGLANPTSVHVGDKRTFFTASWLFADSVAVREIGSVALGATTAALAMDTVKASRLRLAEAQLKARIATAEQVIQGEVIAIAPVDDKGTPPHSEHDPQWWLATIRPSAALKGSVDKNVVVAFPSSTDVAWASAPKFNVGQQAIWILHRANLPAAMAPKNLTALDPADIQPMNSAERIRMLAK